MEIESIAFEKSYLVDYEVQLEQPYSEYWILFGIYDSYEDALDGKTKALKKWGENYPSHIYKNVFNYMLAIVIGKVNSIEEFEKLPRKEQCKFLVEQQEDWQ